jgi:hypothetical protein
MPRALFALCLAAVVLLLTGIPADACGDKLLVLGVGPRFQIEAAEHPASILLYVNPNTPGSKEVGDSQLQAFLRQAGHRLQSVTGAKELAEGLRTGRYDIVLSAFADASALEEMVAATASRPFLLPFVYKGTKAEASAAERRYRCVLKAPARSGHWLATLDKAMELKQKQSKVKFLPTTE